MNELFEKNQVISIVPNDYKKANRGEVIDVSDNNFTLKLKKAVDGIPIKTLCEFYSHTKNGGLFFESDVEEINGNILRISNPVKHRFLQRRKFTRIKFLNKTFLYLEGEPVEISPIDLSAGGMKFQTDTFLNLDSNYRMEIYLSDELVVKTAFQMIRIEKIDEGIYVVSGKFFGLSNVERMTLIQYCMNKNLENINR